MSEHETLATLVTYRIRQIVEGAELNAPIYCIALVWSPGQPQSLPPALGVGLERERAGWLEKHGEGARDYVWNPAEFYNYDDEPFTLEELSPHFEQLNEQCWKSGDYAPARALLNDVCRRLMQLDWHHASPTDDFVAFASDFDGADLAENLKATLSVEQIELLQQQGLFPD